ATRPVPERIARISKIVSVGASTRIATAIMQKVSSAPVIQKMTRTRGPKVTSGRPEPMLACACAWARPRPNCAASMACLLGVRLVFRPRLVERSELGAGRIDGDDFRIAVERHLQPARVVD